MDERRWIALMDALGIEHSKSYFDALVTAYTEPHRFYHTVRHIDAMLQHFDHVKGLADNPLNWSWRSGFMMPVISHCQKITS